MTETRTCPFQGCGWSYEYTEGKYSSELEADFQSERHYEREHAGEVRIQVTLETTQMLGDRDPEKIRERQMEKFENKAYDVAFVRTEVIEEADDHDRTVPREGGTDE